jgi:hypothetical protein
MTMPEKIRDTSWHILPLNLCFIGLIEDHLQFVRLSLSSKGPNGSEGDFRTIRCTCSSDRTVRVHHGCAIDVPVADE